MARGRKPKPTALKLLQGNPGKRPIDGVEPEPELVPVDHPAPDYLDAEAADRWRKLLPDLQINGLLTCLDLDMFAAYCEAWSLMRKAKRKLDVQGEIVTSPKGYSIQSPWLAIYNRALKNLGALAAEFGLTPAARVRLAVTPIDPRQLNLSRDDWAEFDEQNGVPASGRAAIENTAA